MTSRWAMLWGVVLMGMVWSATAPVVDPAPAVDQPQCQVPRKCDFIDLGDHGDKGMFQPAANEVLHIKKELEEKLNEVGREADKREYEAVSMQMADNATAVSTFSLGPLYWAPVCPHTHTHRWFWKFWTGHGPCYNWIPVWATTCSSSNSPCHFIVHWFDRLLYHYRCRQHWRLVYIHAYCPWSASPWHSHWLNTWRWIPCDCHCCRYFCMTGGNSLAVSAGSEPTAAQLADARTAEDSPNENMPIEALPIEGEAQLPPI